MIIFLLYTKNLIVQMVTHNSLFFYLDLEAGSVSDYGAVGAGQQNRAVDGATDQTQKPYHVYSWYGVLKFV